MLDHVTTTRRPGGVTALLLACGVLACLAESILAQSSARGTNRSTASRRTAGGGDFPTWERDVPSDEREPLAQGRPGRYVPAWTADLGAVPTGAVAVGHATAVALEDGRVIFFDADGSRLGEQRAGPAIAGVPVAADPWVIVSTGTGVAAVGLGSVAWATSGGAPVTSLAASRGRVFVARGEQVEALDVADGTVLWQAAVGAAISAGPSPAGRAVAVGAGGNVIALDVGTGRESWRLAVGERVDSVRLSEHHVHAAGVGRSGRSKDITPIVAGSELRRRDGAPGRPWRLRVGATCEAEPLLVDRFVAMACADGYVRAIDRDDGTAGWRTDLPVAMSLPPRQSGGRLDCVIPNSRTAVALAADNGAVLGWVTLPDEDETFVGTAAIARGVTATPTSLGRLLGWRWEWSEALQDEPEREPSRPGADPLGTQRRSGGFGY